MQTQKQIEARKRNWDILRLRGIWYSLQAMEHQHLNCSTTKARTEIDEILIALEAEPEIIRRERLQKKFIDSLENPNADS